MRQCPRRFYRWRLAIVWSLIVGYAGYYLNRSNLSVTQQAIGDETGVSDDQFSFMLSYVGAPRGGDAARRPRMR